MVEVQKRKVLIKRKPSSEDGAERMIEIETNLMDYGESKVEGTNIVISVALATFELKGEDKHHVLRLGDDKAFGDCQKKLNCQPTYAGFIGVFDGHDGCECSAYCAKGLLPHIVAEQAHRCAPKKKSWSLSNDSATTALDFEFPNQDMEITFISAFQKAQQRFCNHMPPPTFEEICKHLPLKAERSKGFNPVNWLASGTPPKRGGSCACTMSVFIETDKKNPENKLPEVIVANTGDSRLITDDGTGKGKYRQVTTDHRPSDPIEKRRLTECVARGEAFMDRTSECRDVRIFPGGLAVSRTIGDAACSRSVICTPEVTRVPLNISPDGKDGKEKSQRFVLGTDGLWDVMSNQAVGKAAARKSSKSSSHHNKKQKDAQSNGSNSHNDSNHGLDGKMGGAETPKQAASRIMEQCLKNGGNQDDITICVVDVSYQQKG